MLPEGCAQSNVAHEDDVQEDEGRGKEPVHVASIVDAAQVAIRVGDVGAAAQCALHGCQWQSATEAQQRERQNQATRALASELLGHISLACTGKLFINALQSMTVDSKWPHRHAGDIMPQSY